MAKGRRERDRPKATRGALYDPNKRVKLSYDSESEGEAEAQEQVGNGAEVATEEFKDADAGVNGDNKVDETVSRRGYKQDDPVASAPAVPEGPGEGGQEQDGSGDRSSTRLTNASTGQWHALGSLSWQDEGGEEDGQEGSVDPAMEYLRSVRAERQTLPTVLSASGMQQKRQRTYGDTFDFDTGDAIIAAPTAPTQSEDRSSDPHEAFTAALKKRFHIQRHLLHLPPSPEAVAALDDKHPISFPPIIKKAKAEWRDLLSSTTPASAQVRSLDQDAVFRLLELIQQHYLVRQQDITSVTSAWIWSLLARLDEVGLMDNDQVYAVRAFGKKAVLVQVSFRSSEAAAQLEDIANAEAGAETVKRTNVVDEEDPGSDVRVSEEEVTDQVAARENTLATLDSILVIVGDIFRQRDLLEFRQSWEVDDTTVPGD